MRKYYSEKRIVEMEVELAAKRKEFQEESDPTMKHLRFLQWGILHENILAGKRWHAGPGVVKLEDGSDEGTLI